jgi:hypothetical protein
MPKARGSGYVSVFETLGRHYGTIRFTSDGVFEGISHRLSSWPDRPRLLDYVTGFDSNDSMVSAYIYGSKIVIDRFSPDFDSQIVDYVEPNLEPGDRLTGSRINHMRIIGDTAYLFGTTNRRLATCTSQFCSFKIGIDLRDLSIVDPLSVWTETGISRSARHVNLPDGKVLRHWLDADWSNPSEVVYKPTAMIL